jgi:hypothetical protein
MAKPKLDDPTEIRIELPLPNDIASTLIRIIGLTYPRTQIARNGESAFRPRQLVLVIDPKDRHRDAKARKKYEKKRAELDAYDGWMTALGPDDVSIGAPEFLVKWWVDLARKTFEANPEAINYLESECYDTETRQNYIFWVARGRKDQNTPHALRQQAEARAEELERDVERLTALAESDEQRLIAANEEVAALRLEVEEMRSSATPKSASAASRRRSARQLTAMKLAESAGTPEAGRSSSRGSGGAPSKSP